MSAVRVWVRRVVSLAGLLVLSRASFASQDKYHLPYKVTLTADVGAPYGEVTASLETTREAADEARRLKLIRITVKGKSIDVPAKQFANLAKPLLDTAKIITAYSTEENPPDLCVSIQLGKWGDEHKRERRTVFFMYSNGKLREPLITQPGY